MTEKIATREAYGKALVELGRINPRIVVLDADLSKSTMTKYFAAEFPDRFFNMGVAEQDLIGTAAGLAAAGLIPFASSFAIFATGRAWEPLRNTICYPALNVKIAATHGGITVGEDGSSHQALEDIAITRAIPNMKVFVPADANETRAIVFAAVEIDGPVYVRLGRPKVPVIFDENCSFTPGKWTVLRDGEDISLIACGVMVWEALQAADMLAEEGVSARVINASSIKPFDEEVLLQAAEATGAVVTCEEHQINGGLGGLVAEFLAEHYPTPMRRVGIRDKFGQSGKPDDLMREYGISAVDIKKVALELLSAKERL